MRLHRRGDPRDVRVAEPDAQAAADDDGLDVEQVLRGGDAGAERGDRPAMSFTAIASSARSARAQTPLVSRSRPRFSMISNSAVCSPSWCSFRARASIAARPA